MAIPYTLLIIVFTLIACSSRQHRNVNNVTDQQPISKDSSKYADLFPITIEDLNKKQYSKKGSYYFLTLFSDSTVKINWGNDTVNRVYDKPLYFIFANRLRIEWENDDYLILKYGVGSGAWETVVLPMNNNEVVQVFDNGLAFDTENNLLAMEYWQDTALIVQNLKTHLKQFIIEKEKLCDAVGSNSCIDTINIDNKILYYRWVTPHKLGASKKTIVKRVQLTI